MDDPAAHDAPDAPSEEQSAEVDGSPETPASTANRLPLVLSTVLAMLVMAGALVAPLVDKALHGEEEAQRARDLRAVQTWDITSREHTPGDVAYPQDPPAGGPHAPVWLACGVYEEPVREENAVHDLEHGSVWITYDPDLAIDDVERLAEALPDNGIMSPREYLPAPVVVTVWGAQLRLDGADDPRLALFITEYGDGHTAPEIGVSCQGGTPDPQGALPGGANA
ncbi:DUF3105 domain-containing protein [Nocardioides zeicaulis]|uniref:DUF3105 domain-containing protein n=1 Tax=Nocardioides zeicaulis TaxID=1776857 RepID=A0ABV6E6Z5_9ACTN